MLITRAPRIRGFRSLFLIVPGLLGACGVDEATGSLCRDWSEQLRSCELVSDGPINCEEPETALDRCLIECAIAADCAELEARLCELVAPPGLEACADGCVTSELDFACEDGSDVIPAVWRCDAEADCADASDEDGCALLLCGAS